jgi:hypothetical protein
MNGFKTNIIIPELRRGHKREKQGKEEKAVHNGSFIQFTEFCRRDPIIYTNGLF